MRQRQYTARCIRRIALSSQSSAALSVLLVLHPILLAQGGQVPDAAATIFRAGVETVVVSVTVRDSSNHLVTTFARNDVRLLVDGRPVTIDVFSPERRPLMLGILPSTSRESGLARVRDIGRALVDGMEPDERAVIGTYADEIAVSPFVTSDRTVLNRVLDEEVWPEFNRAVNPAAAEMIRAFPGDHGKPVLVVAGSDFPQVCGYRPCLGDTDVRDLALREGTVVSGRALSCAAPSGVGLYPLQEACLDIRRHRVAAPVIEEPQSHRQAVEVIDGQRRSHPGPARRAVG